MKTYVLMISKIFPAKHPKAGEKTGFVEKVLNGDKIHTVRANYDLWKERIKEIQDGKAELSLRYWEGLPYMSKQVEFKRLTADSGVCIGKLEFPSRMLHLPVLTYEDGKPIDLFFEKLASNDGLKPLDFFDWFAGYDRTKPMALIHFNGFRY